MIILLNGASSSGKSSIVKELQILFDDLFLGMSIDKFMSMVPSDYQGLGIKASQMWSWEKTSDNQGELMTLKMSARGKSYILGMYECIEIMTKRSFNVIVDDVCLDADLLKIIATKLYPLKIYFVGVTCQIHVLEERERLRGNRVINTARDQHDKVHRFYEYDVMVDTSKTSTRDCALQIKAFIEKNPEPQMFKRLKN